VSDSTEISEEFSLAGRIVVYNGTCMDVLKAIPDASMQLVVTSPPYNLGKEYESRTGLQKYVEDQSKVIRECFRVLKDKGSICWQIGNYVDAGAIVPLDILLFPIFQSLGLRLRNRIVWHFEHGLHCSRRFSGRYETILWFTKSDDYVFNLDALRVPQKYPGKKYFKGPKAGQYSCNPLGKNPGDVWIIPNVKSNHVEKTEHPCQFPVELIERLVLGFTEADDWVFDPFLGTGTSIIAAIRHSRRGAGAELEKKYVHLAKKRIMQALEGSLPVRPMFQPVFDPKDAGANLLTAPWLNGKPDKNRQMVLMEKTIRYKIKK
jgi:adenine-specific DNA-methyltransferase